MSKNKPFELPSFEVTVFDTGYKINPGLIQYCSITSTIESMYFRGVLRLDDRDGNFVSQLKISIGTKVKIKIFDDNSQVIDYLFRVKSFEVQVDSGLENTRADSLGGPVFIELVSSWLWEQTYENKAYKGTFSEIATAVIKELQIKGGPSFSGDLVHGTDDSIKRIRYRIAESQIKFIEQKLKPYSLINKRASYFFVNENNEFKITSYELMRQADISYAIIPPIQTSFSNSDINQNAISKEVAKLSDNIQKIPFAVASVKVGGSDLMFYNYKQKVEFYSPDTRESTESDSFYIKSTTNNDLTIPFDKALYDSLQSTNLANFSDARSLEDQTGFQGNQDRYTEELIEVSVITKLVIDIAPVGSTVLLLFMQPADDTKLHWCSGKYVVKAAEHGIENGIQFSRLICIAPSSYMNPDIVDTKKLM